MNEGIDMEGLELLQSQYNELKERFDKMQIVNKQLVDFTVKQQFEAVQGRQRRGLLGGLMVGLASMGYLFLSDRIHGWTFACYCGILVAIMFARKEYLCSLFRKADSIKSVQDSAKVILRSRRAKFFDRSNRLFVTVCLVLGVVFIFVSNMEMHNYDFSDTSGVIGAIVCSVFFVVFFSLFLKLFKKSSWGRREEQKRRAENDFLDKLLRDLGEDEAE